MPTPPVGRQISRKATFVVINEHMLGCVTPLQPGYAQILAGSNLRGATLMWSDGMCRLPVDRCGVRPAKLADFDTFRLVASGYRNDSAHYEFPTD